MPIPIIRTMRKGTAVLWKANRNAAGGLVVGGNGQPTYAAPVELSPKVDPPGGVFWIRSGGIFMDAGGNTRQSSAMVFVGLDLDIEDLLWEGSLAQLPQGGAADPRRIQGIARVQKFEKIPTADYGDFVRKALL